jgi:hypothetical protein
MATTKKKPSYAAQQAAQRADRIKAIKTGRHPGGNAPNPRRKSH